MKENKSNRTVAFVFLIISVILWASAFSAIRSAVRYFGAGELALLRFLSASVFLILILLFKNNKLPQRKDFPLLLASGLIGISVYHYCLNLGEKTVLAGTVSFLISTIPLFTAILGHIFLKEKLPLKSWIGIFISLAGVGAITFTDSAFGRLNTGVLIILLASISGSIYVILQKKLLDNYSALEVTAYTLIAGTLFLMIYLPELSVSLVNAPLKPVLEGIYLGIFPAAIAYLLWTIALDKINSVARVSVFIYLTPLFALIIAFFWLFEIPELSSILGGVLILTGVFLTNSGTSSK